MSWSEKNYLVDCAELLVEPGVKNKAGDEIVSLHLELRVNPTEFDWEQKQIKIGATRLWLQLHLDGYDVEFGSKLGDECDNPQSLTHEHQSLETKKTGGAAMLNLGVEKAKAAIGTELVAEASKSTQQTVSSIYQRTTQAIIARTNNRWEIRSLNDEPLSGRQIGQSPICDVSAKENANNVKIKEELKLKKCDIWVDTSQMVPIFRSKNKEKIFKALIAKIAQKNARQDETNQYIILSEIETDDY